MESVMISHNDLKNSDYKPVSQASKFNLSSRKIYVGQSCVKCCKTLAFLACLGVHRYEGTCSLAFKTYFE